MDVADLSIRQGRVTVIVGASGSAKSTLARVLSGLCDYHGSLHCAFDISQVCLISQQAHIFDVSLEDNIALSGNVDQPRVLPS